MEITGNPAVFDTAGHTQTIPAFTGTGKLRLTGNGAVAFAQSTLPYGLVLDGIALNLGTLNANAPRLTVPSLEITGPVAISVTPPVSRTGRYPLITCTSSLDDVALGQVSVTGGAGTIEREGNTIYISLDSVTPPTLLHRWSFNGDYTDSVGGITGTNNNSSVTFINDNTAIRLAGGSKGTSWVELNPNKNSAILPPGDAPFTIEMWTTLRVRTNYSAWFTLGRKDNYNVKGLMVAFHNPNAQVRPYNNSTGTGPAFKAVKSDADANNVLMGKNPLTEGGTYHLAIVVTPRGDGDGATIEGYVHDAAGARVGGYAYTVTGWTTASLIRESFALGRNFWGDADPQADYDEVRVWNGALSISQIEANIASGPDALPHARVHRQQRLRSRRNRRRQRRRRWPERPEHRRPPQGVRHDLRRRQQAERRLDDRDVGEVLRHGEGRGHQRRRQQHAEQETVRHRDVVHERQAVCADIPEMG